MSVTTNTPSDFIAQMQDNGSPIDLPQSSSFSWSTDDPTDTISVNETTSIATITVNNPPESRTQLTATASAVDPAGETQTGSLTVDIIAGVTHTYTISVSQPVAQQLRGGKRGK